MRHGQRLLDRDGKPMDQHSDLGLAQVRSSCAKIKTLGLPPVVAVYHTTKKRTEEAAEECAFDFSTGVPRFNPLLDPWWLFDATSCQQYDVEEIEKGLGSESTYADLVWEWPPAKILMNQIPTGLGVTAMGLASLHGECSFVWVNHAWCVEAAVALYGELSTTPLANEAGIYVSRIAVDLDRGIFEIVGANHHND